MVSLSLSLSAEVHDMKFIMDPETLAACQLSLRRSNSCVSGTLSWLKLHGKQLVYAELCRRATVLNFLLCKGAKALHGEAKSHAAISQDSVTQLSQEN